MATFSTKDMVVGDLTLHSEFFGKVSDQAILLISGAMASARFWTDAFCATLAQHGYFVIRYDHRDSGLSSAIDFAQNPYTIRDLEKDALAILDSYGIKKAHLVGHSLGGMLVQLIALHYPTRVLSITSIADGLLAVTPTEKEKKILEKTWPLLLANKPTLSYENSEQGFLTSYAYLNGSTPFDKTLARAYIKDMYERSKHMYLTTDKQVKGFEVPHNHVKIQEHIGVTKHDLRNIHVPCLIIHGQEDYIALPAGAKATAEAIAGSALHIIPGMGHMIFNRDLENKLATLIVGHVKKGLK